MNSLCRIITVVCVVIFLLTGCSQGLDPTVSEIVEPVQSVMADSESSHSLMGLWSFVCDPDANSVEIAQSRDATLHLNALKFLEPPALVHLTMEGPPQFNGNILDVDIGLRNPYLGLDQFSGFDVCGIVFTQGSLTGFNDPEIIMAGKGDTRLLNADGHTRWWNPTEFPHVETIFGYKDGLLGTPAGSADFNCTINGYKYFADGLEADTPVTSLDLEKRGMFRAGQKNVRHYKIDMGDGLIFNYAVDANWKKPNGSPPYTVPDDFPPAANRPEAYFISVTELENSLESDGYNGSGSLSVQIDVWDHFNAEMNIVSGESLAGLPHKSTLTPIGGGEGFSTYQLDFSGGNLTQYGDAELLITVQCEQSGYGGLLPGKPISACFSYAFQIAEAEPGDGWARTWGGTGSFEYARRVAVDQAANCYVVGLFGGPADFDPGPGEDILDGSTFVSKFNPSGDYQWARTWFSGGAWGVDVDSSGNVVVASTTRNLRKYDPDGVLLWENEWTSGNPMAVRIDGDDNIYMTGSCTNGMDLDPGPGIDPAPNSGGYLLKFDSSGGYLWGRVWGTGMRIYGLTCHGLENVFVSGYFSGTVDFDPGPGVDEHTPNGDSDVYLSKFDSDGNFLWCRTWGGTDRDATYGAAVDSSGSVIVIGWFADAVDFDPGPGDEIRVALGSHDCFLSKFDPDGNFLWVLTWGGDALGSGFTDAVSDISIDDTGNIFVGGTFLSIVDFDPGPGVEERTAVGDIDIFALKLDPAGSLLWVDTWGGTGHDEGLGIAVADSGIFFVSGSFAGTVDFNPGPGIEEHTSNGGYDIFLSKFPPGGNW